MIGKTNAVAGGGKFYASMLPSTNGNVISLKQVTSYGGVELSESVVVETWESIGLNTSLVVPDFKKMEYMGYDVRKTPNQTNTYTYYRVELTPSGSRSFTMSYGLDIAEWGNRVSHMKLGGDCLPYIYEYDDEGVATSLDVDGVYDIDLTISSANSSSGTIYYHQVTVTGTITDGVISYSYGDDNLIPTRKYSAIRINDVRRKS